MQALYTLPHGNDPDDATVSEVGAMNIFFLLDKVGTPARGSKRPPHSRLQGPVSQPAERRCVHGTTG